MPFIGFICLYFGEMNKIYYSKIFDLLESPEWLNGIENHFFSLVNDRERDAETLIETARQFQYLYDSICAARFNLCTACKQNYSTSFLRRDSSPRAHMWIQIQFINNAILWYNATFDILLQVIWFYYELYQLLKTPYTLTSETYYSILKACTRQSVFKLGESVVPNTLMDSIKKLDTQMKCNILEWANHLKHRGNIQYTEYKNQYASFLRLKGENKNNLLELLKEGEVVYNSSDNVFAISINDAINMMIKYHQSLVEVSKELFDEIDLFNEKLNEN